MGPPLPQNLALLSKQYLPLSQKAPPLPSSPPPTQPPLPPSQYSLPHLPPAITTTTLTLTKFIMTTDSLVSFYNNLSPKEQYTAWHYLQLQILGRNAGNLVVEDNINVGHGEYFEDVNEMVEKKPKLEIIDFEEKEGDSSSRDEICHIYCTDATEDRTEKSHKNGENKVVCLLLPDDYDVDEIAIHVKEEEKENLSKKKKNHSHIEEENYSTKKKISNLKRVLGLGRNAGNLVVEDNINVGHGEYFEDVNEMVEKKPKLEIIDFEEKEGGSLSRDEICHIYCTDATEDRTEKSHRNRENKVVCLLFPDDYDVDEIAIHLKEEEKENISKKKKNHCNCCDFESKTKAALKKHMKAFHCNCCDFESKTKAALKKHMKAKHNKNQEGVSSSKAYSNKKKESEHVNFADMINNFLNSADNLNHSEETFSCKQCIQKFSSSTFLQIHVETTHKIKCEICEFETGFEESMKEHKKNPGVFHRQMK